MISCALLLQRSVSLLSLNSPKEATLKKDTLPHRDTPYRKPSASATPNRRDSTFWYQTMKDEDLKEMDKLQLKRQEVCSIIENGYTQMLVVT